MHRLLLKLSRVKGNYILKDLFFFTIGNHRVKTRVLIRACQWDHPKAVLKINEDQES